MDKRIIHEFKKTSSFFLALLVAIIIFYVVLCLDGLDTNVYLTDNIDFLIPVILIALIIRHFKYMKIKDECIVQSNIPVSKLKLLEIKYKVIAIQLGLIFVAFLGITLLMHLLLMVYYFPGHYAEGFNIGYLLLSNGIKIIFTFLLLNIFIYLFLKGRKVVDGFSYIIIISLLATLTFGAINLIFFAHENATLGDIVSPYNLLRCVSELFRTLIKESQVKSSNEIHLIQIICMIVSCAITTPLLIKKINKFKVEDLDNANKSNFFKITLLIISIATIALTSVLIDSFTIAITTSICANALYYVMYSFFIERFIPNKEERYLYLGLFILGVFLPYVI